ncbi:hypothetical protein [Sulfitobacter aestuariivivens]|nr:hypothetical protein [Sulfitobacter aestuariivivens]
MDRNRGTEARMISRVQHTLGILDSRDHILVYLSAVPHLAELRM